LHYITLGSYPLLFFHILFIFQVSQRGTQIFGSSWDCGFSYDNTLGWWDNQGVENKSTAPPDSAALRALPRFA